MIEAGISTMHFNYAELGDNGSILDKELGNIRGLSLKLSQKINAWELEGTANYSLGRVDYRGQTNSGIPYNTRTDEEIGDVALQLGRWFKGVYPIMPYAGVGYHRWNRDILPADLGGLFESYHWQYAWLGAKILACQHNSSNVVLNIGWIRPINPALQAGVNNVNPESRDGFRLLLTHHTMLTENTLLILEPYFESWQLGRSANVTSGGSSVYEPSSKTKNIGLNLRLGKTF